MHLTGIRRADGTADGNAPPPLDHPTCAHATMHTGQVESMPTEFNLAYTFAKLCEELAVGIVTNIRKCPMDR